MPVRAVYGVILSYLPRGRSDQPTSERARERSQVIPIRVFVVAARGRRHLGRVLAGGCVENNDPSHDAGERATNMPAERLPMVRNFAG